MDFTSPGNVIAAVVDGVSSPWTMEPKLYGQGNDWITSGQFVAETILANLKSQKNIIQAIKLASCDIANFAAKIQKIPHDPAYLPGACVAAIRINEKTIEVIQCGDSLVLWEMRDGSFQATKNLVYPWELLTLGWQETLKKEYSLSLRGQDEKEWVWERLLEKWCPVSRTAINRPNGYAVINGQNEALDMVNHFKLIREDVRRIMICTDGAFAVANSAHEAVLAQTMFGGVDKGGLQELLKAVLADSSPRFGIQPEAMIVYVEL